MAPAQSLDPIGIVERAYELQGNEGEWVDGLLERVGPAVNRGSGVMGFTYRWERDKGHPVAFSQSNPVWVQTAMEISQRMPISFSAATLGSSAICATQSQLMATLSAHVQELSDRILGAAGVADVLSVHAAEPEGGVIFTAGLAEKQTISPREASPWRSITAHIAAALRLRRRIEAAAAPDEAILSPTGAVLHAEEAAKSSDARERLRLAARAIDRARGSLRRKPDEAMELWRALCDGRWSLVDRFESDGRRFVVARRNEPNVPRLRALSEREAAVAAFLRLGHTNKQIAYELGISLSSVGTHVGHVLRKLGLPSRAALAALPLGTPLDDVQPV
jgi:DNA-binding CsgD family transcriptional regulator